MAMVLRTQEGPGNKPVRVDLTVAAEGGNSRSMPLLKCG